MFSFNKSLTTYDIKWEEAGREKLTPQDIDSVDHAEVTQANYGLSVCFFLKNGGRKFIQLSKDSALALGDSVNPAEGEVITLKRPGEEDKYRWMETF